LRTWPFVPIYDSSAEDVELVLNLYGAQAVSAVGTSTTRVAPTIAAAKSFMALNTDAALAMYGTDWAALAPTSASTGLLTFTAIKTKWGGTCSDSSAVATVLMCDDGSAASTNDGAELSGGSAGDILLFKSKKYTGDAGFATNTLR